MCSIALSMEASFLVDDQYPGGIPRGMPRKQGWRVWEKGHIGEDNLSAWKQESFCSAMIIIVKSWEGFHVIDS